MVWPFLLGPNALVEQPQIIDDNQVHTASLVNKHGLVRMIWILQAMVRYCQWFSCGGVTRTLPCLSYH